MQVKVQTVPGFAKGMLDGFPKFIAENGVGG
jgi:solute carrier family 25 phosphate transporter 3